MYTVDMLELVEVTEPIAVADGCCRSLDLTNSAWKQDCAEAAIERQCETDISSQTGEVKCLWLEPCTLDVVHAMYDASGYVQEVEMAVSSRCEWDGSGSGDAVRMQSVCARYSEEECVASEEGNKDARCAWRARVHVRAKGKERELSVMDRSVSAGLDGVMGHKVIALVFVLGAAALIMVAFTLRQVCRSMVGRDVSQFVLWEEEDECVHVGARGCGDAATPLLV